ncbi:MAG: outer membrane protein assembly factor BamD [Verrucomicrobiota bacterium]|jgi:outer membrane protein assembly factor BamD
MKHWCARVFLVALVLALFPTRSPAPLVYRPGEGWSYESPSGKEAAWRKPRAKDQLDVAQQAFDKKDYSLALKAAQRVVSIWPLSDYAPQGQYLVGRCYEAEHQDERAFKAYDEVLAKFPKMSQATEIQGRQFDIASRFLAGERFRLLHYFPIYRSMDKTAGMFEKIVRFGPYGPYGPASQMGEGAAREKQKDYPQAVKAYELAADRYAAQPKVAADALFKEGMAYEKQARKAEYDQSVSDQAISTFRDFIALYPDDPRVADANKIIKGIILEQARGNFAIAQYYEKTKQYNGKPNYAGAVIYYNQVVAYGEGSPFYDQARERIAEINQRLLKK